MTNTAAAPSSPSVPAPALSSPSARTALSLLCFAMRGLHAFDVGRVIANRLHDRGAEHARAGERDGRERDPPPTRAAWRRRAPEPCDSRIAHGLDDLRGCCDQL